MIGHLDFFCVMLLQLTLKGRHTVRQTFQIETFAKLSSDKNFNIKNHNLERRMRIKRFCYCNISFAISYIHIFFKLKGRRTGCLENIAGGLSNLSGLKVFYRNAAFRRKG